MDFNEYIADFRSDFPEFTVDNYPDDAIEKSLCEADLFFNVNRWGAYGRCSAYRQGWFNLVAHQLLISMVNTITVELGGIPSAKRGTDSYSIGDVSEVQGSQIMLKLQPWNDSYATTPYGVKYMQLRYMVGAGPIVV